MHVCLVCFKEAQFVPRIVVPESGRALSRGSTSQLARFSHYISQAAALISLRACGLSVETYNTKSSLSD
jgi:hypothetical protein